MLAATFYIINPFVFTYPLDLFTPLHTTPPLTPTTVLQVGMDELENQTIQMWRHSEKTVASLQSSLVQIDPMQRYIRLPCKLEWTFLHEVYTNCILTVYRSVLTVYRSILTVYHSIQAVWGAVQYLKRLMHTNILIFFIPTLLFPFSSPLPSPPLPLPFQPL